MIKLCFNDLIPYEKNNYFILFFFYFSLPRDLKITLRCESQQHQTSTLVSKSRIKTENFWGFLYDYGGQKLQVRELE